MLKLSYALQEEELHLYLGLPPPASAARQEAAVAAATPAYGAGETHAFGLSRVAVGYAVVHRIMDELRARCPGFKPKRVLDLGSGPGTAIWAVQEVRA